jgi:hypothetical protein
VQQMHQVCLYNFKDRKNVLMIIIFHVEKEITVN